MSAVDATGLRLALFTDTSLPQLNGVTRTLDRLTRVVRARGGEVLTLTTTDDAAVPQAGTRRFASVPFWAYPQLRIAAPLRTSVARELRDFEPTLIHAATPFGVGLAGRAAARRSGVPFVTSYHTSFTAYAEHYGLGVLAEPGWHYLRWFHAGGQHTYCPTRAVQHELKHHGIHNTRLWTRGVDTSRFSPTHRRHPFRVARLEASPDAIVVAYVGRLASEKGLAMLLEAMHRVRARATRPIVFAFAGDGPYADACRARAPEGTRFLGRLEGDALAAFYASSDIFVFPSRTDTFGNVLLEAMASRVPVIAADAPSTREVLLDGQAGVLVTDPSAEAMAEAILGLAGDAVRRTIIGMRGEAVASTRSWDTVFDELLLDYAEASRLVTPSTHQTRANAGAATRTRARASTDAGAAMISR